MRSYGRCLPGVTHSLLRHTVVASLIALSAVGAPSTLAASPVAVSVEREGDAYHITASATLRTDVGTAWRILTSYGDYARFIPGIRWSRVTARHGDRVTVEQSDDSLLWPLHWPLRVIYEITERPPDRIESRTIARMMPSLDSHYRLTTTANGVRVDYTGRVDAGFAALGDIEQWALERSINRQFQALADEIERNPTEPAASPPTTN